MNFLNRHQSVNKIVSDMRICKSSFKNIRATKKRKVVFIIGSGLSNAAAGLPLGVDMAKNLVKVFVSTGKKERQRFKDEINLLVSAHNFLPHDFKTVLFSLYKIYNQKIVDKITTKLDIKSISKIDFNVHETLVSLLRKNYSDGIINFNFDEILEHVIVKNNDHRKIARIINTQDAKNHTHTYDAQSKRFKTPIHLKPHGSISTPSSLRFVRKDFYRLEPLVGDVFFKLLGEIPVTIVLIGFCIKNLDFTEQISNHLQPGSSIYVIDKKKDVIGPSLEKFYKGFIKIDKNNSLQMVIKNLKKKVHN